MNLLFKQLIQQDDVQKSVQNGLRTNDHEALPCLYVENNDYFLIGQRALLRYLQLDFSEFKFYLYYKK